jgi:Uma2 family endonuclease
LYHVTVSIILASNEDGVLQQGELTPMPIIEVVRRIEVPDLPDIDLPYDDGEPLESNWHRLQINLLGDMLHQHWPERTDFFAGGNMFIYYSLEQARTRDYKGPDFFVALGVDGTRPRHSWIVWQEEGRYPDVIVELLSPTTMSEDLGPKKDLYERVFKTADYFCVNPADWSLRGWNLGNMHYSALQPDARGWLWAETLQLWLGIQEGRFQGTVTNWLRFFTPAGRLVLTAEEAAESAHTRAETERARAEAEHARVEALEAENARLRAELERLHGSAP